LVSKGFFSKEEAELGPSSGRGSGRDFGVSSEGGLCRSCSTMASSSESQSGYSNCGESIEGSFLVGGAEAEGGEEVDGGGEVGGREEVEGGEEVAGGEEVVRGEEVAGGEEVEGEGAEGGEEVEAEGGEAEGGTVVGRDEEGIVGGDEEEGIEDSFSVRVGCWGGDFLEGERGEGDRGEDSFSFICEELDAVGSG
jgi:hypothetical protein